MLELGIISYIVWIFIFIYAQIALNFGAWVPSLSEDNLLILYMGPTIPLLTLF